MQKWEGMERIVGLCVTRVCLMAILVFGVLPSVTLAQINVIEPNLHDGARVYGVEATAPSPYVNSQDISLLALGETDPLLYRDVAACAYGLLCDVVDVNLVNTGTIDVNAIGGNAISGTLVYAYGFAYGIRAVADVNNIGDIRVQVMGGTVRNDANDTDTITWDVSDACARGIFAEGDVNNTGAIALTATGGVTSSDGTDGEVFGAAAAFVYGIDAGGDVNNTGAMSVTATAGTVSLDANDYDVDVAVKAEVCGIDAIGGVNNTGAITAQATGGTANASVDTDGSRLRVDIDAFADAYGIDSDSDVANTGAIALTANGGMATMALDVNDATAWVYVDTSADAHGIHAVGDVTNTGAIDVAVTGGAVNTSVDAIDAHVIVYAGTDAYVCGIDAVGAVDNAGAITVTAAGGSVNSDANDAYSAIDLHLHASASAYGLKARGAVDNTGALRVSAAGGITTATAMASADAYVFGIYAVADVNTTGDITVTATAQADSTSYAYGIYLDEDARLTNTGMIRASGDIAREVYVESGITTLVDTYNVTLDGDPNDASFYVNDGATLALNDSSLTVTPISGETLWDTEYRLFETAGTGVVDGNFADVQSGNPNTTATYNDQSSADSSDDTVALAYTPVASPMLASSAVEKQLASQPLTVVDRHMTNTLLQGIFSAGTSGLLADAGPTYRSVALAQSDSSTRSGIFFEPYYSRMDREANPLGYDARLWGFTAGYERQMDNTLVGLHAGYGRADVDYTGSGYSANSEDQDLLTGGLSALTRWNDWTLRYGVTGYYGWHDYQGLTGLTLTDTETASMDSYGVMASAMAGYVLQRGSHVFLPEAGLTYIWGHRQRYTTEASDTSWDTTYSALDDHDVQAAATLHWLCGFTHKGVHVTPSASIGIRRLLTDAGSTASQSVAGAAPVSVKSKRDRTAMTLSGSVVLRKARHTVSLAYDGEYSPDTERHSIWLRYGWQF